MKPIKTSFLDALGTVAYVLLVVLLLQNANSLFGDGKGILVPIMMLMLFVLSAAVTGSLVIGRPLLMYLNGQKKEALQTFLYTLLWLLIAVILVAVILVTLKG